MSWCLCQCTDGPDCKDYYEDLTAERFGEMIDAMKAGQTPSQVHKTVVSLLNLFLVTSLEEYAKNRVSENASVQLASTQMILCAALMDLKSRC